MSKELVNELSLHGKNGELLWEEPTNVNFVVGDEIVVKGFDFEVRKIKVWEYDTCSIRVAHAFSWVEDAEAFRDKKETSYSYEFGGM